MSRPKGIPKTGGRAVGTPNKATKTAREAFAQLVEDSAPRMQQWLDSIAADPKLGPMAAFRCVLDISEYHLPKLARTELTGKDGADLVPKVLVLKQE